MQTESKYSRQVRTKERDAYKKEVMEMFNPLASLRALQQYTGELQLFSSHDPAAKKTLRTMQRLAIDTYLHYGRWPAKLRALHSGFCVIKDFAGNKCAVGRCLQDADATIAEVGDPSATVWVLERKKGTEWPQYFAPKYRSITFPEFYNYLLVFHDSAGHWVLQDGNLYPNFDIGCGLTPYGKKYFHALLIACGYTYNGARAAVTNYTERMADITSCYRRGITNYLEPFHISDRRAQGLLQPWDEFELERRTKEASKNLTPRVLQLPYDPKAQK
jgi:hypothetical protein